MTNDEKPPDNIWDIDKHFVAIEDSLLHCLVLITKIYHHPFSGEALTAGLPLVDNSLTPELAVRAADRAGLAAKISTTPLDEISSLSLPAVLLLKNKKACVLERIDDHGNFHLLIPESGSGTTKVSQHDLEVDYTGHVIFIRPAYRFDKRTEPAGKPQPKHWFWGVVFKAAPLYSEILVASFLVNLFAIASPLFVMNVYDRVVPNNAIETLWVLAIGIFIVYVFDFILKTLRSYFVDAASKKIDARLSANIYEQILGIKMNVRPRSIGTMANMVHSFEAFRDFMTSTTITALIDVPFVAIFIFVIASIGGNIALIPIIAIPIVITIGFLIQMPLNDLVQQNFRFQAEKQAALIETLSGVETIKSVAAESPMQKKWERIICMAAAIHARLKIFSNLGINVAGFTQQLCSILVIIFGVYKISVNELSMGGLIACTILTGRTLAPMIQIAGLITRYHQSVTSLTSLNGLMEMPVDRPHGKTPLSQEKIAGDIEFQNVTFNYPEQSTHALQNVSFKIKAGEKIGIIGRIGSGKTTIERLIASLYPSTDGTILIDDIEVHQYDVTELRRQIGYVPQDITLFYGTIKDNIVLGAPYVDDKEIIKAAKISGVLDFVRENPKGFDMVIDEQGGNLSGGQKQAIAIARALLLDPPIILFDEPTSAMDDKSDALFKKKLKPMIKDKTVIVVTHRASMLSLVDRLIILDAGKLIADGPKEAVLTALKEGNLNSKKSK